MTKRILITGGGGFIGSHLADHLLVQNCKVRVLDNLCSQVHGCDTNWPAHLNRDVELITGDVQNPDSVARALEGVDAVFHFAAEVGVGQSMYQVRRYVATNTLGTAVLAEAIIKKPVERLVVASSMSIYGEGLYRTAAGQLVEGHHRPMEQLVSGQWELKDENGDILRPHPTPETKRPSLASIYALSKYDQEAMCMMLGRTYDIPTVALRFFNVYGPRQALSNPYTGVLAIFASRLINRNAPLIFEDGHQRRDFVSVFDVVQACVLALTAPAAVGQVINVGSGWDTSVREVADRLARALGQRVEPAITRKYRHGDVRHCFADITKARTLLGYEPRVTLEDGLAGMISWLEGQVSFDRVEQATAELVERGLAV